MGTIDIRNLHGEQIVVHYGGALTSVDAYTFANSLISFSDAIRAVNSLINPGQNIEIRLEAVGQGSFRAVIKRIRKGLGGFFSRSSEAILFSIIGALIYDNYIKDDVDIKYEISDDVVVIVRGNGDRIIMTKETFDGLQLVKRDQEVQKGLSKTFSIIENDSAVENFGVTEKIDDERPLVQIDRSDFARLSSPPEIVTDENVRREKNEEARLVILKPWLQSGKKKWAFEWNGVPISAPITDDRFQEKLLSREYLIGAGDALDVKLRYFQDFDEKIETFVNDNSSFEVIEVKAFIARDGPQASFLD